MNFHIITIFPEMFDSYFNESILGRAQEDGRVKINIYNLRDYADQKDKRRTVDDTPYGGGPGMVMMVEPIFKCVKEIKSKVKSQSHFPTPLSATRDKLKATRGKKSKVNPTSLKLRGTRSQKSKVKSQMLILLTSAKGKLYNQEKAKEIKKSYTDVIIICGRYEGVDERVAEFIADEEVSIGEYILTGGELPAMVIVDSITRLIDGVLGNEESLKSESYNTEKNKCLAFGDKKYDYPVYTKPAEFNGWKVPEILLSGNHKEIEKWRARH